ncbi:hypothetical protein ACIHCV_34115 [Streptomyces sp. NPDC051956]|uniref:hypothetical protein n=1 Tax=Streptomyces sp. NPDC051956 TaxID=3365677 RepID=UPI0037D312ED
MTGYLDRLAELLREAHGLPPDHVAATVADLAAYLAQAGGADPQDAFGPAEAVARRLAPSGTAADEHLETWRWLADTYVDEHLLNRFGDEGWEVERVDPLGRFVSHRDPERPRRWEYRRELITGGGGRLDERLAPDGWEPCGSWVVYAWFKREKAAGTGPEPAPSEPPPVPRRPTFPGRRRGCVLLGGALALAAAVVVAASTVTGFGVGLAVGLPVGALVPPVTAWAVRGRRR